MKCITCGEPIEVNPEARIGEWRYKHVRPEPDPIGPHPAIRDPGPVALSNAETRRIGDSMRRAQP
jgi:hypothetical protein